MQTDDRQSALTIAWNDVAVSRPTEGKFIIAKDLVIKNELPMPPKGVLMRIELLSRSAGGFSRSRKVFQPAGANVIANLLHHAMQSAGVGEIFIDLAVPAALSRSRMNAASSASSFGES